MARLIVATFMLLVVLGGCREESKLTNFKSSSVELKTQPKEKKEQSPVLVPTELFQTKVFGSSGPIIYVVAWIHDGGAGLRFSKAQVLKLLGVLKDPKVNFALEGFWPVGEKVTYGDDINSGIRDLLSEISTKGTFWGGDDAKLQKMEKQLMRYILQNGRKLPDEEVCMTFYGINKISRMRTEVLLKAASALKSTDPEAEVIALMGDAHFELYEHEFLESFARQNRVRLVLYATKGAFQAGTPRMWDVEHCGPWSEAKGKTMNTLEKVMKEEGLMR